MNHQRGLSLIELMVAMLAGLFLIAGAVSTYLNSKNTFRVDRAVSGLQENGRFALETLTRDLRLAGFGGCNGMATANNVLNSAGSFNNNFSSSLQGFEALTSTWSPALDSAITSGTTVTPLTARDVITVRRPEGSAYYLSAPFMASGTESPHVDAGVISPDKIKQGHFVLVGDCNAAAIFQVSNADVLSTGTLAHAASNGSPGNSSANLGNTFGSGALAVRLVTATYFVAASQVAPGTNALWLRTGDEAPIELAEGVDNMQIVYGEDTDGDLTANRYVTADQVGDMGNVVSVRISLLMSTVEDNIATSPQPYSFNGSQPVTPTDRKLRSVFTTVINIRNRTP